MASTANTTLPVYVFLLNFAHIRFTADDVKSKWYSLTRSLRRLKDRKRGGHKTYDWPYYDLMTEWLDKNQAHAFVKMEGGAESEGDGSSCKLRISLILIFQ